MVLPMCRLKGPFAVDRLNKSSEFGFSLRICSESDDDFPYLPVVSACPETPKLLVT